MSQISSSTFVPGVNPRQSGPTDAYSKLTSGDFVKIIISELSRQDPLKPNDSSQLVQDMSNLRSIQASIDMQEKLDDLVGENQFAAAANLIGKGVSGLNLTFDRVEGVVRSVSNTTDGPILNVVDTRGKLHRMPFATVDELVPPPTP